MVYDIIEKIYKRLFQNYMRRKVSYLSEGDKKKFLVETGVKIHNKNVFVGSNVKFYHNVIIFGDGPVVIDNGSIIGYNTIIYSSKNGGVYIGKQCAIAANTYIIDTNHSTHELKHSIQEADVSKKVEIGDRVWIAAQCVIGKGAKLNDNVIVGANSFVNREFPCNAIIAGTPASIVKYRSNN